MRKYKIYYYKEIDDECIDFERLIEGENIDIALENFKEEIRVFKRVYKIEEI